MKRHMLLTLLLGAGALAVAAGPVHRSARPVVRCSLPVRNYQFEDRSQPVSSVSAVGILAREPLPLSLIDSRDPRLTRLYADPMLLRGVRRYEFVREPRLRIDHCYISKMSVLLHESGHWTLSLRADQNPVALDPPAIERNFTTSEGVRLLTEHLRRNLFFVNVRCYANYGGDTAPSSVGRPLVVPLEIDPFWVQNGEPYWLYRSGHDPRIREWYAEIDRVELEFHYR